MSSTHSRRAVLASIAALASIPAAAAVATSIDSPKDTTIQTLVAAHREALDALVKAYRVQVEIEDDDPRYQAADQISNAACDHERAVRLSILLAEPTDLAGLAALLRHVASPDPIDPSASTRGRTRGVKAGV
jgi:hypothetical protein